MSTLTEPTAYDTWVAQDPARGSGEIDFGTIWTSDFAPGDHRVSFVQGTGELIVVDERDELRVLGRYPHLYAAEDALGPWFKLALEPGSLDGLIERFPDHHHLVTVPEPDGRPVFGLVVDVNGDRERIHQPFTDETLMVPFSDAISDLHALPIRVGDRGLVLGLHSDDRLGECLAERGQENPDDKRFGLHRCLFKPRSGRPAATGVGWIPISVGELDRGAIDEAVGAGEFHIGAEDK